MKERKERIDEREKNVSKLFMSHKMKEVIHKDVFDLVTQRAQVSDLCVHSCFRLTYRRCYLVEYAHVKAAIGCQDVSDDAN